MRALGFLLAERAGVAQESTDMSFDRRKVLTAGVAATLGSGMIVRQVLAQEAAMPPAGPGEHYGTGPRAEPYSHNEIVKAASDFFGTTSEAIAGVIEKAFKDNGEPTGYISGEEGAAAVTVGLRYGKGRLYMKHHQAQEVFWQGPSIGFDFGGNASRVFTLCYGIARPGQIYHRFPGVEGTIYVVAGFGLNYQRANGITLAPIRTGVGARAGANVGYLAYTRKRHILPF